jgi:hypothetical protein
MMSRFGLGLGGVTRGGGAADPILAIFADGTDGFYFDFSKTDRLFQAVNSGVLADDAGESIALALESSKWSGRTRAQELAQQTELFPDGGIPNTTGWTPSNATLTAEANGLKLLSTASGAAARTAYKQFDGLTIGWWYYAELDVTEVGGTSSGSITLLMQVTTLAGAAVQNSLSPTGTGKRLAYFQATATSHRIQCRFDGGGADTTTYAIFDNISVKEIPRFHGLQTTGAAQPKWQTGGLARFDGSDDLLATALTASGAAGVTLMAKFLGGAAGAPTYVIGGGSGSRLRIGQDISGQLVGGIGSHSDSTIVRSGSIAGQIGVGALTADGTTVKLFWNGAEVYSGAQSGTFSTTVPIVIGAYNNSGVPAAFFNSDAYHALAIRKALTAAEISAITNLWGTT